MTREKMPAERWTPQPYEPEVFLSFDRLKRAVMKRVLDRAEQLMEGHFPIEPERIEGLVSEEWQQAKEALKSSPAAREAFRKYLQRTVGEQIDRRIKTDKAELEALGVAEKSL